MGPRFGALNSNAVEGSPTNSKATAKKLPQGRGELREKPGAQPGVPTYRKQSCAAKTKCGVVVEGRQSGDWRSQAGARLSKATTTAGAEKAGGRYPSTPRSGISG
jgi:hypothetical protein